jgi:predicted nucleic acid-binding protein
VLWSNLREVIETRKRGGVYRLRKASFRSQGLQPAATDLTWEEMRELAYGIMVYAHREDSAWHEAAFARIVELAEGRAPWAIPWPCVHEFLAIVTHPKIHAPPTPLGLAIDQVEAWPEAPTLVLLSESGDYWRELRTTIEAGRVVGPQVHDARVSRRCVSSMASGSYGRPIATSGASQP